MSGTGRPKWLGIQAGENVSRGGKTHATPDLIKCFGCVGGYRGRGQNAVQSSSAGMPTGLTLERAGAASIPAARGFGSGRLPSGRFTVRTRSGRLSTGRLGAGTRLGLWGLAPLKRNTETVSDK